MLDIDFIIPWVDGSDPNWISEYNKYADNDNKLETKAEKYRDYGLLRFWFRGVEQFSPWVRKIHFITNGQKPTWLNTENIKINFVKHEDYIPPKYLPVFSPHPIELYLHNIPDLSEHFVYFNDDFYLTAPIQPSYYFKNGQPCDSLKMKAFTPTGTIINHVCHNDIACINNFFSRKTLIRRPFKLFNTHYGLGNFYNAILLKNHRISAFRDPHTSQPYTKSLIKEVWENCSDFMEPSMKSRFRTTANVNQWLFRYWNLCKGNFHPINPNKHKVFFELSDNNEEIVHSIKNGKYKEVIINDGSLSNPQKAFKELELAFLSILPNKSSFEI